MKIIKATNQHIQSIINIAKTTWPITYKNIITTEQINFMLSSFYTTSIIEEQLSNNNHYFLVATELDNVLGYAHIYLQDNQIYKLSKLYILPNQQGKKIGATLLNAMEKYVTSIGNKELMLNVNRFNSAKDFYSKHGYKIIETIDIPLGKYWLNDFIMKKNWP